MKTGFVANGLLKLPCINLFKNHLCCHRKALLTQTVDGSVHNIVRLSRKERQYNI